MFGRKWKRNVALGFALPALLLVWGPVESRSGETADRPGEVVLLPRVDGIKNLIRVPLVRQSKNFTCGVASLESVLGYYHQSVPEGKLAERLKTTEAVGTRYWNMVRFARNHGYKVRKVLDMALEDLEKWIDRRRPVIVIIQAWADPPVDYPHDWNDGHYVVAVGYDDENLYFMDPSTLGHYTFIPREEFLTRWHDRDDTTGEVLNHFGLVLEKDGNVYDPEIVTRLK